MAAVLEKENLGPRFLGEIKTDGAVAAAQVPRDAATGAHAVDLVNADVGANVKFAPRFDKNGAAYFVCKELFQGRAFVFDVGHRGRGLKCSVVESGRFDQTGGWQGQPVRRDNPDAHTRVESSGPVLPRVGAECDADRFACPDSDRDPKMINVSGNAVDFRRERDGSSGDVDKVAVLEAGNRRPTRLFASRTQRSGEMGRRRAFRPLAVSDCDECGLVLFPAQVANRANQSDRQGRKMIPGQWAQEFWCCPHKLVSEPKQAVAH